MLYKVLHFINEWFAIVVLWVYIAAFFTAMGMMFIWPQVTMLLMFLGLAGLGAVFISNRMLQGIEHILARQRLARGVCPQCGHLGRPAGPEISPWRCDGCGAMFLPTGAESSAVEDDRLATS